MPPTAGHPTTTPTNAPTVMIAVGAIEPQFYAAMLAGLGLDAERSSETTRPKAGADQRSRATTADHWRVFANSDACVTLVGVR